MVPNSNLREPIAACVLRRHNPVALNVSVAQTDFERDEPRAWIIITHKHWSDRVVLPGADAVEVDEGRLKVIGSAEGTVVRLVDGSGPVVIEDRSTLEVQNSSYGAAFPDLGGAVVSVKAAGPRCSLAL